LSVEVGRYGRIVLPKRLRDRYGVEEGTKLIIETLEDRIVLLPVRDYDRPTEALYGSIRPDQPVDKPKKLARDHTRQELTKDLE
jgi:AbrB family looped-hinge helix DNA binding protein